MGLPLQPYDAISNTSRTVPSLLRAVFFVLVGFGLAISGWFISCGYRLNLVSFFYGGLLSVFVFLLLAKKLSRGVVFQNVANTMLLLVVGLCLIDAFHWLRAPASDSPPIKKRAYSYDVARGDPQQFRNWWNYYVKEWRGLFRALIIPDPNHVLPFKLRPGAQIKFAGSRISINSLGFQDREFQRQKHGQYRIVALGESTTMGVTMEESDRTWPAALEALIDEEPDAPRPVEVINAGVSAYNLADGLAELRENVLSLKPDLLITYYGYNGFDYLIGSTTLLQEEAPIRNARPSPTLEMFEYRWQLGRFQKRNFQPDPDPETLARLTKGIMESHYAQLYRELISIAQKQGIPLVLASFNMAVNPRSPPEVIEFYRAVFPAVNFSINANRVHNRLIQALAKQYDGVYYVDTSEGLDGAHDQYIDIVHFTQSGRERLARNIFAGVDNLLKTAALKRSELGHQGSDPGVR